MNRRELMQSVAAPLVAAGMFDAPSTEVSDDLVIVSVVDRVTPEVAKIVREAFNEEEERIGKKILFLHSGMAGSMQNKGKYGHVEKINNYSVSFFCQTKEEMDEWLTRKP